MTNARDSVFWSFGKWSAPGYSFLIASVLPLLAHASGLPRATISQALMVVAGGNADYAKKTKAGSVTRSVSYSHQFSHASATDTQVTTLASASVSSAGAASGNTYSFVNGYSILTYYFAVVGPKAASVPVIVTVSGSLSETKDGGSLASIQIINAKPETFLQYGCGYGAPATICGAYSTPIPINVVPVEHPNASSAAWVQIESVDYFYTGKAGGSISATIEIDPQFSSAGSYSIVTSQGVGLMKKKRTLP